MSRIVPAKSEAPNWSGARAKLRPKWGKLSRFLDGELRRAVGENSPKYKILQDGLAAAIRKGVIGGDELLPTESELTKITPFSLGTVQRAMKNLVTAGLIVRKAGVGTIVTAWRRELENPLHTRFIDKSGEVLPVYTEVLSRRRVTAPGPWENFLQARQSTLVIKRRLIIKRPENDGGDFSYYNEFYVDGAKYKVFQKTPKRELNGVNFKRKMAEEFSLVITRISNHMSICNANTVVAVALGIDVGTPVIRQRVYVYSLDGPLYYQEYWIPPDVQEVVIDTALDNLAII